MEPLSLLFSAIVAGAGAALKPTAEQVVKDAYAGLKTVIQRKWGGVGLDTIENDPASEVRQAILREDLEKKGDPNDLEVLEQARALLAAVAAHDAQAGEAVGITVENIRAGANVNIRDLIADGPVAVRDVSAEQDVTIGGLRSSGAGGPPPNPTRR